MTAEPRPAARGIVATLGLATLAYALLLSLVSPALSTIERALGTTETTVTWVLTAFVLSAAVSIPVAGRLGDLYGRRRLLLACLAGLAVGSVVSALATDVGTMILGRALQGLGGGVFPLAYGIFREELPRERVGPAIGVVTALFGLGLGSGIVFSAVILHLLDYHWLFWLPCAAALVAAVLAVVTVPESPQQANRQVSWSAALLMSAGLTIVLVAVSQTSVWGWGSVETIAVAGVGVAFVVGWALYEHRSDDPLAHLRLLVTRELWITNLLAVAFGASVFLAIALLPRLTQSAPPDGYRLGALVISSLEILVPLTLAMVVVTTLAGRVQAARGSKATATIGTALSLAAFVLLLGASDRVWAVSVAAALLGVGAGFALAAMADLISRAVPPDEVGAAKDVNTVSSFVGSAFGGQVGATLLANSAVTGAPGIAGYQNAFLVAIVVLVLALTALAAHPGTVRD